MPMRNVELTEHFDEFIEEGIGSGRFSNASEIVREGLRLLEQREKEDQFRLEWLRTSAREAFDQLERGEGFAYTSIDDLASDIDQIGEEVSAEIASNQSHS